LISVIYNKTLTIVVLYVSIVTPYYVVLRKVTIPVSVAHTATYWHLTYSGGV
jgi:hypothetical protein